MKFKITEQNVVIAPKANSDVGRSTTYIKEAESFEALLIYNEDTDEGWLYKDNTFFSKNVLAIEKNERNFFTNEDREYWGTKPRSEDGYALKAIEITIVELTEEQANEEIQKTQRIKDAKLKSNNDAWFNLLKSLNLEQTNQGTLLDKLQEYNFPTKIKNDKS